jgi:hypothetical protein
MIRLSFRFKLKLTLRLWIDFATARRTDYRLRLRLTFWLRHMYRLDLPVSL